MADDTSNWISTDEAFRLLQADKRDPIWARDALIFYLREGRLGARATEWWLSRKRTFESALKDKPAEINVNERIPSRQWRQWKRRATQQWNWNWVDGNFIITTRIEPIETTVMIGVEFDRLDLQRLHPNVFGYPENSTGAAMALAEPFEEEISGRGQSEQGRINAWLEIVEMALDGKVTGIEWSNKTNLAHHIASLLKQKAQKQKGPNPFATLSARSLDNIAETTIKLIKQYKLSQSESRDPEKN